MRWWSIVSVTLIASVAQAQEPRLPEKILLAPPMTAYAKASIQDGKVKILLKLVKIEPGPLEARTIEVHEKQIIDGKEVVVTKQMPVTVLTKKATGWRVVKLDGGDKVLQFHDTAGKPVPMGKAAQRLAKDTPILVSTKPVDPFYLQTVKPGTLILVAPTQIIDPLPTPIHSIGGSVIESPPIEQGSRPVAPKHQPAQGAFAPPKSKLDLSTVEKELIELINAERKKAGAAPLEPSPELFRAARRHSANMAKQGKLEHVLDGKGLGDRLKDLGYHFTHSAENVALGQRTPAQAVASWMNSPGHRANLLGKDYVQVGVAVVTAADGQRYWTLVLAAPASA